MQPKKVVNYQAELDELQKALDAGAIDQDTFDTRSSQLKTNWGKSITGSAVV
jgi:hypothetical protein